MKMVGVKMKGRISTGNGIGIIDSKPLASAFKNTCRSVPTKDYSVRE